MYVLVNTEQAVLPSPGEEGAGRAYGISKSLNPTQGPQHPVSLGSC